MITMSMTSSRGSVTPKVHNKSDSEVRAEIVRLIDTMTSTGQRRLDDKLVRDLKQICRYVYSVRVYKPASKLPEISGISVVMYVSELFVEGKCIIDSLAGPWKKLGVLGGDDLKNNNDDLKRPKNVEILVAPLANERRTRRISFNVNNPINRIEIRGFAAKAKCDKLE